MARATLRQQLPELGHSHVLRARQVQELVRSGLGTRARRWWPRPGAAWLADAGSAVVP
jgi:hypothetical protein